MSRSLFLYKQLWVVMFTTLHTTTSSLVPVCISRYLFGLWRTWSDDYCIVNFGLLLPLLVSIWALRLTFWSNGFIVWDISSITSLPSVEIPIGDWDHHLLNCMQPHLLQIGSWRVPTVCKPFLAYLKAEGGILNRLFRLRWIIFYVPIYSEPQQIAWCGDCVRSYGRFQDLPPIR